MIQQVHRMDIFCTAKQLLEPDSHDDLKQKLRFQEKSSSSSKKMQWQQHCTSEQEKWKEGLSMIHVRSIMMGR